MPWFDIAKARLLVSTKTRLLCHRHELDRGCAAERNGTALMVERRRGGHERTEPLSKLTRRSLKKRACARA